jgi:hypothetical protein
MTHPLVRKIVRILDEQEEDRGFTLSQVTDAIGHGFFLARRWRINDERERHMLPQTQVISLERLHELDRRDRLHVFATWEEYVIYEFDEDMPQPSEGRLQ